MVVSYSGARGRGIETYLRRVVSLSKALYFPKVLVIPRKRWLCLDMTEKLLTGTLNLKHKQTNHEVAYLVIWLSIYFTFRLCHLI